MEIFERASRMERESIERGAIGRASIERADTAPIDRPRIPAFARGKALVLGLDAEYASVVCEVLSTEFETRMTNGLEIGLGLIASRRYEVVVIDASVAKHVTLPALVAHIRSGQPDASLVVTSQVPFLSRDIVECLNADADDYLPAPFHPSELLARVMRGVRRARRTHVAHPVRVRPVARETSGRGTSTRETVAPVTAAPARRRTAAYEPRPSVEPFVAAARAS